MPKYVSYYPWLSRLLYRQLGWTIWHCLENILYIITLTLKEVTSSPTVNRTPSTKHSSPYDSINLRFL